MCSFLSAVLLACAAGPLVAQARGPAPFTVTITTSQESCKAGDPCMIHIVLKNISTETLALPEIQGNRGEFNYRVLVWSGGSPAKDTHRGRKIKDRMFSGGVLLKYLDPGQEIPEDTEVSTLVDLSVPGDYTVQVERVYDHQSPSLHIRSNKITIHIAP